MIYYTLVFLEKTAAVVVDDGGIVSTKTIIYMLCHWLDIHLQIKLRSEFSR